MFRKMKLRMKLLLTICSISLLGFAVTIGFVAYKAKNLVEEEALVTADETAYRYSGQAQLKLASAMDTARVIAQSFEGVLKSEDIQGRRATLNHILAEVLRRNDALLGTWTVWEPDTLDGLDKQYAGQEGHDATGRFIPYWYRDGGEVAMEPLVGYDKPGDGDYYQVPLQTRKETILEPYFYEVGGKKTLLTTLAVPLIVNGKTVGVAGVDIALDSMQSLIAEVKPFETGYGSIISNTGIFVAHPKKDMVGKNIADYVSKEAVTSINQGKAFTINQKSAKTNTTSYIHFVPIQIGSTSTPWSFAIIAPIDKIFEGANSMTRSAILISLIALLLFVCNYSAKINSARCYFFS